jgi:hypothetical protein
MNKIASPITLLAACALCAVGCSDRTLGDARPAPVTMDPAPGAATAAPPIPPASLATPPDAAAEPPPQDGSATPDAATDRPATPGDAFTLPDVPILGDDALVPGGPCGDSCTAQLLDYHGAVFLAQRCTPGQPGQCQRGARSSLSCGSAPLWLTDDRELVPLVARYRRECSGCLFTSTMGGPRLDSCPPLPAGYELAVPMCAGSGLSPNATCFNFDPRRDCTPDVMPGLACAPRDNWCRFATPGVVCVCGGNPLRWSCNRPLPPAGL